MTTTTETQAPERGPYVVLSRSTMDALTENARRMREMGEQIRENLSPAYVMAQRATQDAYTLSAASDTLTRQLAASLGALAEVTTRARVAGRSEDLVRLGRDARKIARGNTRISVTVSRVLSFLRENGRHYSADLMALALRGDAEAREEWESMAGDDDGLAVVVLTILADLDGMVSDASELAAEVAALVAEVSLSQIPETTEPIPPPRITLTGSLDVHAPPVASRSATAANVRPARGRP